MSTDHLVTGPRVNKLLHWSRIDERLNKRFARRVAELPRRDVRTDTVFQSRHTETSNRIRDRGVFAVTLFNRIQVELRFNRRLGTVWILAFFQSGKGDIFRLAIDLRSNFVVQLRLLVLPPIFALPGELLHQL